jgi:RNA polymerase sigma-70 factor (ECF subfamily)
MARHKAAMAVVIEGVQPAEEFALDGAPSMAAAGPALEEIFREHHPRIVGMLARLTGDRQQAEDIAGDVFCKLARRPAALHGRDDLTAWVYKVATNAGFDALRRHSRRRRREEAAGAESLRLAAPSDALHGMLREERRARVRAVLEGLKPRDAQLLLLRSSGLAYREVAQALGVAAGSVGTLLARAEAEFERRFRARYGDGI